MGEMADFYIERGERMADFYIERGERMALGRGDGRVGRSVYGPPLKCKHCGATDVYWQRERGAYKIFDKATLSTHVCRNTAEGFEECRT